MGKNERNQHTGFGFHFNQRTNSLYLKNMTRYGHSNANPNIMVISRENNNVVFSEKVKAKDFLITTDSGDVSVKTKITELLEKVAELEERIEELEGG